MSSRPRSHVTRAMHIVALVVIVHQLVNSTFMERPMAGDDPDWPYVMHVWTGTAGLLFLSAFWIWVLVRDARETQFTEFFPWLSPSRLHAIFTEIATAVGAIVRGRVPPLDMPAIAASIHGAGLILATWLAASGVAWAYVLEGTPYGRLALTTHKLAGNLMWVYLIGHVLMGALHQLLGDPVISRMFWLRFGRVQNPYEAK